MPENLSWFVKDRNFSGATEELQSLDSLSDCNFSLSRTWCWRDFWTWSCLYSWAQAHHPGVLLRLAKEASSSWSCGCACATVKSRRWRSRPQPMSRGTCQPSSPGKSVSGKNPPCKVSFCLWEEVKGGGDEKLSTDKLPSVLWLGHLTEGVSVCRSQMMREGSSHRSLTQQDTGHKNGSLAKQV